MANVVITGGTKGIGEALANKFLELGDKVVVTSRNTESAEKFFNIKSSEFLDRIFTTTCDVTNYSDIVDLSKFAIEKMGTVDFWINNAGTNGEHYEKFLETPPEMMQEVVNTNITGCMWGTQVALGLMKEQGYGHILNMNGLGSNGRTQDKLLTYGLSKWSLPYLTKALSKEYKGGPGIHNLSPGMVITDLVTKHINKDNYKIFNILCESPETVAEYLVPRMKKVRGTNKTISFTSGLKMMLKFITPWKYKNKFYSAEMFD